MRKAQSAKPVFPVGLLLGGRCCLVVGGGRTAYHKTSLLLEARANVLIVSPDIVPELAALTERADVDWIGRSFQEADVEGITLAYAATNDRAANQHVLEVCRSAGAVCCCVDKNWPRSDFITPATFRHGGLVVTVSTGGRSCRHSRLVRDTLERHIQLVEKADLLVIGTSHAVLPIDRREPFHLSEQAMKRVGLLLSQIWGIHEFAVLNTCNRIEVLAAVAADPPVEALIAMILGFDELAENEFYTKRGKEAFEHTALLCAGLLSQTPGENNIVAQVKQSLNHAETHEWAGGIMNEWLDAALHISKHIRHTSGKHLQACEIDQLCLKYLDEKHQGLNHCRALVVGAGVVGHSLVSQLVQQGTLCTWCYHVNQPELPDSWKNQVTLCRLDDLGAILADHELVICAATSDTAVITATETAGVAPNRPLTIVDLAIPRNVSPQALQQHQTLTYLDLDSLKRWYRKEALDLDAILETSHAITTDHADFYDKLIRSIQGGDA